MSPSVFLAAAIQRTSKIRIGPLVYVLPLHHPLRLYEEICMLDHLSGGRLTVGVGRGGALIEHQRLGVDPALTPASITRRSACSCALSRPTWSTSGGASTTTRIMSCK